MLEARRAKIAGEFAAAERAMADANEQKSRYEQELRGIEVRARQRLTEAVAEGQKVAAEIRHQAQAEAASRLARAQEDITRESEKARERIKQQVIDLALLSAEKILRRKLDGPAQRQMAGEFLDEVEALQ
jgi:F-type H+-transporting ATPase subunit b